jgi:hypothetical protein
LESIDPTSYSALIAAGHDAITAIGKENFWSYDKKLELSASWRKPMAKPARRKDLDQLAAKLEDIADRIAEVRGVLGREAEARALMTSPQLAQALERVAALLTGVTVALERMGGTTLPGFREDISSLRAQMSEFQHEMAGYRAAQMELANLAEALKLRASDWPPMATDAAPSEEISRVIVTSPPKRRGRPKKDTSQDTSQKLIDEIEQEVVEE